MITVDIKRKGTEIIEMNVSGHAAFAKHGEDLVCAGVSSIMVGTLNAIDQLCEDMCALTLADACIQILVKTQSEQLQTILQTTCIQLETMCKSYDKFIKINDQEV